ncbi:MAG TPA: polysaccharide biosynthesis tyrosine autokinase [Pseudonocardia sp.]
MTLRDYLRVLREQWVVVLLAILICLGLAAAYFFIRPPQYTAKLTMYVSSQGADTTQAAFQGAQLSQDRVASYTELVTSPRVTGDVIAKLGLPETPDELAAKMTATSKLDSVLIDVTVKDPSAQRAAQIVNAVGDVFPTLVGELERPTDPRLDAAVAVRVVKPADPPILPSSAGIAVIGALGLLVGVALGIGCAFLRNALDVSIKSLTQLQEMVGAPNLGIIAHDAGVPKRPLTVHDDPRSPWAEGFRQLRTNLQFVDVDNPRKILLITSSMPGEGKTTTVANLAIAMASAGNRVLLVEADLRRPRIAKLLGLDGSAGLTTVLTGKTRLDHVVQSWAGGAFDILASGPLPPNPSELLGSKHMLGLLQGLRMQYDVVLIDSPPLLPVTDAAALAPITDGAILVCRYKQTTRVQIQSAMRALSAVSAPLLGTVFTMVPGRGLQGYAQYSSAYRMDGDVGRSPSAAKAEQYDGRKTNGHRPPSQPVPGDGLRDAWPSTKLDRHR